MRGCLKAALAFGLVATLAAPVMAQGRGGFGGGMGGGGVANLIANPGVQKELKLTSEQIEKATALAASTREQMTELRSKLEGLEGKELNDKRTELMKPITEENTKKIKGFLKDGQYTRLTEIDLQQRGATALTDPAIAKKLSVTDEQATKVKSILADQQSEMQELRQSAGNDFAAMMPKIQALRKETNSKVMALMSADQKKTWKEMTGEPFEVPPMQRPARNN
jgi:Spy/CpxP family protein refolding chaperone